MIAEGRGGNGINDEGICNYLVWFTVEELCVEHGCLGRMHCGLPLKFKCDCSAQVS